MRRRGTFSLLTAVTALASALGLVLFGQGPAQGHGGPSPAGGAPMQPGSRTFLCLQDGKVPAGGPSPSPSPSPMPLHADPGSLTPHNPACAGAVAESGLDALEGWSGVAQPRGDGRTEGFIPDGKLCSGNDPRYSGFDQPGFDWPVTHLTAGADFAFAYPAHGGRSGVLRQYVTVNGWDPTMPLTWDQIEDEPFAVTSTHPAHGPHHATGAYDWTGRLPAGKFGRHIIYSVWQPAHSRQTFYSCSDVVFDGGHGEVTGVGDSTPAGPRICMGLYNIVEEHAGGFTGAIEVMNHDTTPMHGWTVTWKPGLGADVVGVDDGILTHNADGTVTVNNAADNATIAPDDEVVFDFTATSTGIDFPIGSIHCTSP